MLTHGRAFRVLLVITLSVFTSPQAALGQAPPPNDPPAPKEPVPPPASAVAATVNGQVVPELAVFRGLIRANPKQRDEAAKEILNYLIDNVLIDQYLTQLKIQVDAKDVDQRIEQIIVEAKKDKQDFDKILQNLHLSEAELRK